MERWKKRTGSKQKDGGKYRVKEEKMDIRTNGGETKNKI